MALNHNRKSGKFCSKKALERSQNIAKAAQLKWSQYRQKHVVETVSHDHDYLEYNEGSNVCNQIFDVYEKSVHQHYQKMLFLLINTDLLLNLDIL